MFERLEMDISDVFDSHAFAELESGGFEELVYEYVVLTCGGAYCEAESCGCFAFSISGVYLYESFFNHGGIVSQKRLLGKKKRAFVYRT